MKPKSKSEKSRLKLLHQYYNYTGFYKFVWNAILKALPYIIAIVAIIYVVNHFFNINQALARLTEILPAYGVLSFFCFRNTFRAYST